MADDLPATSGTSRAFEPTRGADSLLGLASVGGARVSALETRGVHHS